MISEELFIGGETVARSTPGIEATVEIEPGDSQVFFSIYDAENALGRSTVEFGNITFEDRSTCGNQVRLNNPTDLVALGDSYASGFGVAPFEPGTDETDGNNCQRSTQSYPELLVELGDFDLDSRACQGASTKDLYENFDERREEQQLNGLGPDTAVVVPTIGGNDTDRIDVLTTCVVGSFLGPACNENAAANEQVPRYL